MQEPELEDSPDLTDGEVGMAEDAREADLPGLLCAAGCPACDAPVMTFRHELRRRAPNHYWRVRLHCAAGHESVKVYRMLEWRMNHG